MVAITGVLIIGLAWWSVSLLEQGHQKKDTSLIFAASLVAMTIGAVCVVHSLMMDILPHLIR